MAKFLDKDGLTHFWSKIKTLLAGKSDTTHSHSELNNDLAVNGELYVQSDLNVDGDILVGGQRYADLFAEASHSHDEYFTNTQAQALSDELNTAIDGKADSGHTHSAASTSAAGFMTAAMVTKLNGIATGATKVSVDASLSTSSTNPVQNKVIATNINALNTFMNTTVPNTYAKKTDISTAYKACGSVSVVPSLAAEYIVGDVLNVTAAFTTTADFVEGAGKKYPAGTNIVKVNVNSAEKWDVLAGFVDLSSYATNSDISDLQGQIDDIEAVTGSIDSITTTEIDTMMNA